MPYELWSGFAYSELKWSPSEFWDATVWDIVSAIMYSNKKNQDPKKRKSKSAIDDMHLRMEIKGRI